MEVLYELWLHCICGFEPDKAGLVAFVFEEEGNRLSSSESDARKLRRVGLEKELKDKISDPSYFKEAREIEEYCKKNGIRIITQESAEYPEGLRNIDVPPRILFAKGERLDFNKGLFVSVVGCRKPTPVGKNIARRLGESLARNGAVVVSGMAEGIDGEAHKGALEGKGKTVAVLAGSVDAIYPKSNEKLYYEILKNGTILSERPPGTVVKRYFYQQRNRLVVGLSRGTVVVEGKNKSGTAITARLAVDNNRDAFAVPGNPLAWQSELPNRLISEGAIVVNGVESVSEYYRAMNPELFMGTASREEKKISGLTDEDIKILKFIEDCGGVAEGEDLAMRCGLPQNVLGSRLTILCIRGILRQESGNRYILVKI